MRLRPAGNGYHALMRVTHVIAEPRHVLRLTFNDGVAGRADLSDLAGRGVFTAWSDPEAFAAVEVDAFGGLVWPDEVDLCADMLYLRVAGADEAGTPLQCLEAPPKIEPLP